MEFLKRISGIIKNDNTKKARKNRLENILKSVKNIDIEFYFFRCFLLDSHKEVINWRSIFVSLYPFL